MQYTLILSPQEIDTIARVMQEGPYKYVKPILDNIAQQIDIQNQTKEETLTDK